jgi:hypothetical protein
MAACRMMLLLAFAVTLLTSSSALVSIDSTNLVNGKLNVDVSGQTWLAQEDLGFHSDQVGEWRRHGFSWA